MAFERNRGAASLFAPYLRLLPEGVPSLWMKPEQEVADFMSIIGMSHRGLPKAVLWAVHRQNSSDEGAITLNCMHG